MPVDPSRPDLATATTARPVGAPKFPDETPPSDGGGLGGETPTSTGGGLGRHPLQRSTR